MSNNKSSKASITVEASLVLPIFILAMYAFIFFIQVLSVQAEIQQGLLQTARYCEKIGYVYDYVLNYEVEGKTDQKDQDQNNKNENKNEDKNEDINEDSPIDTREIATYLITSGLMQAKFYEVVDQQTINKSCVVDGMQGLNFLLSSYDIETNIADVSVQYKVHIPIGFGIVGDFYVVQKSRVRVFVGFSNINPEDEEDGEEDSVYITETGTVYHESKECTYLKLSISKIARGSLDNQRNSSGGKYYKCEICKPGSQEYYYITKQGNRYHSNTNCSGLKRTIKVIKRSEVGDRRACTRCGKH